MRWLDGILGVHWKDWCWSWNFNTLATWWEELTHWKRPCCWEWSRARGEGDDRGWDGWMALRTQWTWVCVDSGSWWWTGRPGVLRFMESQRVGHDWATKLNWLNGHGFGWTLGVGDGQGGLVCCDSWGHKELDTTEWLNWTELNRLNGHGFGWTLGVGNGQGGLACCCSWGCKESDTTEWLN